MMLTASPDQIKRALIDLAASRGRPEYEMFIVKQVVAAFKENKTHPLKAAVQSFINTPLNSLASPPPLPKKEKINLEAERQVIEQTKLNARRLARLKRICLKADFLRLLAVRTQMGESLIKSLIAQRTMLTNHLWLIIEPEITLIEKDEHISTQTKKLASTDTYWY